MEIIANKKRSRQSIRDVKVLNVFVSDRIKVVVRPFEIQIIIDGKMETIELK